MIWNLGLLAGLIGWGMIAYTVGVRDERKKWEPVLAEVLRLKMQQGECNSIAVIYDEEKR